MTSHRTLATTLLSLLILAVAFGVGCSSGDDDSPTATLSPTPSLPVSTWTGDPTVETKYGTASGSSDTAETWTWKGIPFAKPPVDELRWKAPQETDPWEGVFEASDFCSQCPQYDPFYASLAGSEDCLYLNIWRPQSVETRLPVYVWIHGGGNSTGSAAFHPGYYGASLASRSNMVFVSVNYRLGPLGWLTHPALRTGNPLDDSGNYGTLDLIQALKWIRDNITAFGGDPGNVVITGESAGAFNVLSLLISPLATDLFHKAISQSGGQRSSSIAEGETSASNMIVRLLMEDGTAPDEATAAEAIERMTDAQIEDYLRSRTPAELIAVHDRWTFGMLDFPYIFEDGTVVAGSGFDAMESGAYPNRVPLILGSNMDEVKTFLFMDPSLTSNEALYETASSYGSALWKADAVDEIARRLASHADQPDVYAYRFDWGTLSDTGESVLPDPWGFQLGAAHSIDVPFFLGNETGPISGFSFSEENQAGRKALTTALMSYVAQFVRTGDPNPSNGDLPAWQTWSNAEGGDKCILLNAESSGNLEIEMSTLEVTKAQVLTDMEDKVPEPLYSEAFDVLLSLPTIARIINK